MLESWLQWVWKLGMSDFITALYYKNVSNPLGQVAAVAMSCPPAPLSSPMLSLLNPHHVWLHLPPL